MIVRMYEIINFDYFYNEVKNQKLPFKILYKLSNLAKAINEKTAFYREKLQEVLKEYGELDENGNLIPTDDGRGVKIRIGTEHACYTKVDELQSLEVEMPDIKFDIEDFGDMEITIDTFNLIRPFIN